MSISLKRYIDITSGVGAAATVSTRNLIARLFTTNALVPTGDVLEFNDAAEVGEYFGTSSAEYLRALFYFTWVSKNITKPQRIAFARWSDANTAPLIYGAKGAQAIATWNAISSGSFTIQMGAFSTTLTALDFSAAANLAAVAAIIQTAVRAYTAGGALYTSATVAYDATRSSFNLVGGATGPATISVTAGAGGSDIAGQLGWLSALAIFSDGSTIQTITEVLESSTTLSSNFGSFAFIPTTTNTQIVEAATWNLARNNEFMYSVRTTVDNADEIAPLLEDIGGVTVTLAPISTEYPEQIPMMILAATDYTAINSTQNYMFQIFGVTPSVTTDAAANVYDGLRVNYYGQTQTAGQQIEFYQRGEMMGLPVDPRDQNTYANEMWLKDASTAAILTLLLALAKISANAKGRAQVLAILQSVINLAILNGTISVGKPLTETQKLYIAEQTGNPKAWYQVQNQGYWVDAQIVPYVEELVTKYKIVYTLIYSKDDIIRKVEGRDILI
jgi:hypothetical protein